MSTTGGRAIGAAAYCPACGAERHGDASFCERCGHQFANGQAAEAPTRVAQSPRPEAPAGAPSTPAPARRKLPWLLIAGAVLVVAGVVVAVVLLSGGGESSDYPQQVSAQVAKVSAANDALTEELARLKAGTDATAALTAATAAATTAHDAQIQIDVLSVPKDKQSLHAPTDAALASEVAYLAGVTSALKTPSEAAAASVTPLALDARNRWAALAVLIPGAGGRITGYDQLATWARTKAGSPRSAGGTTGGTTAQPSTGGTTQGGQASQALISYIAGIENVLAYARPGFDRINQVYAGMKAGTISWDDARAGLDYVLTNRQNALARANALDAPTTAAADVKRLLAAALEASLTNDRDILAAFNSYGTEDVQSFYNSQVVASASSSAATSAKRSFLAAYNQLRSSAGLGDTQLESF